MTIKTKFGAYVQSKTPASQINGALLQALCPNTVALIDSIRTLGIITVFRAGGLLVQSRTDR